MLHTLLTHYRTILILLMKSSRMKIILVVSDADEIKISSRVNFRQHGNSFNFKNNLTFSVFIFFKVCKLLCIDLIIIYRTLNQVYFHLDLKYRTVSCFHSSVLSNYKTNYLQMDRKKDRSYYLFSVSHQAISLERGLIKPT